jgi:nucleoside-diphosphate-sugar epimerase
VKARILVLGATGFIGKRVVDALRASDWASPVAASRRRAPAAPNGESPSVQLDATDAGQLRRAMDGVDGVVNCVLGNSKTIVDGARALFSVAGGMPQPPRIVHFSSLAVYGEAVGDVDESAAPVGNLSAYGAAKFETERLAAANPSIVTLRPGIVYGPGGAQWSGRIAQLLYAHRLGDLGRGGDGYCNLVYIDDVAVAVLRALRAPHAPGQAFNLSLPDPPTWNEYLSRYAAALGAVPLSRIAQRRLRVESKLLAPPQKIAEIVVAKLAPRLAQRLPQPIPPSLVRLFRQEIRMRVGRAEKVLGLAWTPLEEGLRQTAAWYRRPSSNPMVANGFAPR